MLKALPLGRSSFVTLRTRNEIYVDKTALVYQIAQYDPKVFLARPRRFGKSLLISTFESLFKDGIKYFHGLAIEKLWTDRTYSVIRLDFSEIREFSDAQTFKTKFHEKLAASFSVFGFSYKKNHFDLMIQLSSWLASLEPSSLVILIDEYDSPLTNCLNKPKLFEAVRSLMSEFFLILKANEGCLRFFFMTGITKFSSTNIFSAFNNLQDISMNPVFGSLLGYTEDEICTYFSDYLEESAQALNTSSSEVLLRLKDQYDGFCFDSKAQTHVFCPWSVLSFFRFPQLGFENYWYATGGQSSVLQKYLINHPLSNPIAYSDVKEIRLSDLNASRQYDDIGLDALLTQAGYFTIRKVTEDGYAVLGYPNQEVASSMAQLYADKLIQGERIRSSASTPIRAAMRNGDLEAVIEYFNDAVNAIDYHRYPITDEASCRAYLQVLLIGAALIPKVETHSALGRSDMEVDVDGRHWVFEFKYARKSSDVEKSLADAIEQIKTHRYGYAPNTIASSNTDSKADNTGLLRVALVFNGTERRFTAWQQI